MLKNSLFYIFAFVALAILGAAMFTHFKRHPQAIAELQEELSNVPLQVQGKIPAWLSGSLLRNGPVNVSINGKTNKHWFDGLAMLHAFSFQDGKVQYTNKFLRTEAYKAVFEEGTLDYEGFASDPCRSLFKRFFTWFIPDSEVPLHNANVNIGKLADQYVALTEVPLPVRFDPHTLETLGVLDFQDALPKDKCWESAHPHPNLQKKETVNYLIQFGRKSFYTLYGIPDGTTERRIIADLPVQEPSYMHSFAVTENYIILTEYPFTVNPMDLMLAHKPFIANFKWRPEQGTQFTVVNRNDGTVVGRYRTKPFFAFHHANAFEDGDMLNLDIVCYADANVISGIADHDRSTTGSQRNEDKFPTWLERFSLALPTGKITSEVLLKEPMEMPRINPAFDGKPYRFVYVADVRDKTASGKTRALYKIDTSTKQALKWTEEGCFPGEPVFVAAPGATKEDEGVVLALVNRGRTETFLLVLDGTNFKEMGRAIVTHVIPDGLHGQYYNLNGATTP